MYFKQVEGDLHDIIGATCVEQLSPEMASPMDGTLSMKNAEFVAHLTANTNKTNNLRTYGKTWYSGAKRIDDSILSQLGRVIALIQDSIEKGMIIDKTTQCLLVYNLQPLMMPTLESGLQKIYLSFDALVKPISELNETHILKGTPFQLVIETSTGEVMNTPQAMLELDMLSREDLDEDDKPISFGFYKDYEPVCGFVALASEVEISCTDMFMGFYDNADFVMSSIAYDCVTDAFTQMKKDGNSCCWVGELVSAKKKLPEYKEKGLGKHLLKLINPEKAIVELTTNPAASGAEDCVNDEVKFWIAALSEPNHAEHEALGGSGGVHVPGDDDCNKKDKGFKKRNS